VLEGRDGVTSVTPVAEGEKFKATLGYNEPPTEMVVGPKCDQTAGRWMCVTHDEVFPTQLAKDSHISRGEHRLAWVCIEHGPEVP
jgi:hypothetical protein